MDTRDTLIAMSDDARGWLRAWAGDFTDDESVRTAPNGPNPLAWHLGHVAGAEATVCGLFAPPAPVLPPLVAAVNGSDAPPPGPDTRYASLAELWATLDATHARWLEILRAAGPSDLDRPSEPPNKFFKTLGQSAYELALHENYHVGMVGALRKALGKPRIG